MSIAQSIARWFIPSCLRFPSQWPANLTRRDAWLKQMLEAVPAGSKILDAGAGELRNKALCTHLKYVSQDFAQYDGKGDGAGLQTRTWDQSKIDIVCDIVSIPEPDASFDAILCVEVLEHLPDPVAALREFSRLLKSGGVLILTAPFCSLTHFAPYHFSTGFSRYFYEKWLPECGLKIAEITPNGDYFEYLGQEIARIPSVAERYAARSRSGFLGRAAMELAQRYLLNRLLKYSQCDTGSNELLAFDIQIKATRQSR